MEPQTLVYGSIFIIYIVLLQRIASGSEEEGRIA